MNDSSMLLPGSQPKFRSRSMGIKLIVVCGMALASSQIPEDRA